ncbi:transcriptional regulator [Oricola thermophila]|uniref:Transcriptional regulator n=1 Tax=Oricola thermophila TaxID=2742145 RepID=A0A6N1V8I9_9HYPH|nr:transcriptional regulator [Oricola thermophila]QKV17240.1 transcriptional regulator [Oricola thermophila]
MSERRGRRPRFDWNGKDLIPDGGGHPITPAQCRMARAGVVMSVRELARLAEVSGLAVTRFENGNTDCPTEIVHRFKQVLEARGARFLPGGDGVKIRG